MKTAAELKLWPEYADVTAFAERLRTEAADGDRSQIKIEHKKDHIVCHINAKDTAALRSTLNILLQCTRVYEDLQKTCSVDKTKAKKSV